MLHETNYRALQELKPNVAILPWGATEAHNYHLPCGTDAIEATSLGEAAVAAANAQGARCILLPTVPFGINHSQLYQVATITMRAATQQQVLFDIADSLVRQGIDRLVIVNFHGGNEFKSMIRDIMFELPIYIVQINSFQLAPEKKALLTNPGDHADEFETALVLHLTPEWVAPLETAGEGAITPSKLPALSAPGVWCTRDWQTLTADTGVGDPRQATAEQGAKLFTLLVEAVTPVLVQLSAAQVGDFPFIINRK